MKELRKKIKEVFSPIPRFAENDEMDVSPETAEHPAGIDLLLSDAVAHAEAGEIQSIKNAIGGHGEQIVLPDECQFGDNDLCYVEA